MLFPLPPLVQDICENASSSYLPTPRASASETRTYAPTPSQMSGSHGKYLQAEVMRASFLPTPTTRDYKDTPGMTQLTEDGRDRTDQLPRRIYALASSPVTGGMKLTPEFLCWLMGFPPDWLKPLAAAPATPSSRKSPKSSPKP